MNVRIEVTEEVKPIRSKKTGKEYTVQIAYLHAPASKYPEKFEFFAPDSGVIKPGTYALGPDAIYVSDNRLGVNASRLVLAAAALQVPKAA